MVKTILFILLATSLAWECAASPKVDPPIPSKGFCGWATKGACKTDADCMTGGCSGQVCQSKKEEPAITTCEYRDCYRAESFGVKCGCVKNKCQWQ